MTTRPAPRLRRPHNLARALVGTVLALTAVLAPIDSPDLPPPLHDLVSSPPAAAQTPPPPPPPPPQTVFDGTPSDCPADPADTRNWQPNTADESLCELSTSACPEHPLAGGTYLSHSTEFPDFCEATVLESADAAMYQRCTGLTGYTIKETGTAPDRECRMIQPARCGPDLHRIGFDTCLSVQRRTWSCPSGAYPRNQFNSCYRPPTGPMGTHPACGSGAPAFPIMTCEGYVAEDFERDPTSTEAACSGFDTGGSPGLQTHAANRYWCRYEASLLDVACHAAGASCQTTDAYCIKRASRTGGCNTVADTLRCRSLQADFLDRSASAEDVYRQGCTPCVVLPFSRTSSRCPNELTANPSPSSLREFDTVHARKSDYAGGGSTPCTDPPRGRLVWESSHHTRSAVVNAPIILNVIDIPTEQQSVEGYDFNFLFGGFLYRPRNATVYFEYPDATGTNPLIRTWPPIDETRTYTDVSVMMDSRRAGECRINRRPDFRVTVEELWPDNDQSTIEDLFGSGSLAWWAGLSTDEKRRKTEARGLKLIDGTDPLKDDAERARRATALTQELRCNEGSEVWCRWLPERSGYYRLVAAGAWWMKAHSANRAWRLNEPGSRQWGIINDWLRDNVGNRDGRCTTNDRLRRARDYDCIIADLIDMGYTHPDGSANPEAAGMLPDIDGLLPRETINGLPVPGNEALYTAAAGTNFRCEPRDLRVSCGGTGDSYNYTETEPVGILVHEVRVNTVTPTR